MEDLYEVFHRNFEVIHADSNDLLDEAYKLRYQIYCKENQYENADDFPYDLEHDKYDSRSSHCLVKHIDSDCFAGVVRLILPDRNNPEKQFPIEKACGNLFEPELLKNHYFPRESMAEISRFAVSRHFKEQILDQCNHCNQTIDEHHTQICNRLLLPHLPIGLLVAIIRMAAEEGITHWYAVMEATFLRFLSRFGIEFNALGAPVEYHGLRIPCYVEIDEMMSGIYRKRPDIWELMSDHGRQWPLNNQVARSLNMKTGAS